MWTQMSDVSAAPAPRNCHSWTLLGQRLFMVGGFTQLPDPPCLPLAALDLDDSAWVQPVVQLSVPSPLALPSARYAHSTVGFQDSFLVVFGGYGAAGKWLNDLWLADVRSVVPDVAEVPPADSSSIAVAPAAASAASVTSPRPVKVVASSGWPHTVTWHAASPSGVAPPPRAAHSAVLFDTSMVVFGGNDGAGLFNDAWLLRLSDAALAWQLMTPVGSPPTPRSGHSAVAFQNQMVVFGGGEGWGGHCFNDLYCGHVDLVAGCIAWMRPSVSGTPPPPRTGHTASGRWLTTMRDVHGDQFNGESSLSHLRLQTLVRTKIQSF
jgi:hypothetical protein